MKREVNFFPIGSRLSIDLPPPRAVPVEFLNPAFRDYIMTLTRGCCVLSCRISKSLSSNKKMRMKSKIFTSFLLAAVLLSGCKKDDPAPDKATLSVSPQTAIAFTGRGDGDLYRKGRHQSTDLESRVFAKLVQGRCGGGSVYGFPPIPIRRKQLRRRR